MAARSFRHYLKRGESKRINGGLIGTHEINASIKAAELADFWLTAKNNLLSSRRKMSFGRVVKVRIKLRGKTIITNGRVSERRRLVRGALTVTELRFRPMAVADARKYYGGLKLPGNAIAVVTRSRAGGVDYDYEVVLPDTPRHKNLTLARGAREKYD